MIGASDILDVSADWSHWSSTDPARGTVPRSVSLPSELRESICLVVQGVRRCGKSTLLRQLVARYGLDPRRCAFLNLEDPRLSSDRTWEVLDGLVEAFRGRHGDEEPLYFFLDEIQAAAGWERWLRAQLDLGRNNVFAITGSNATLLSGELGSVLTGRHISVELFPFDLEELRIRQPELSLETYLEGGGFPATTITSDRDALLRQYFHDIVERDIRERVGARSSQPIAQLLQMAYETAGSEASVRRLAASAGISVDTAGSYLAACEAAYVLGSVQFFAWSERKRASRNRKYYPVDTGLRRVVVSRGGSDRGKALECAVHLHLRRRLGEVFYWRGRHEVDFVVRVGDRLVPIQVSWDGVLERHELGFAEFYETFPMAAEGATITSANFETELPRITG